MESSSSNSSQHYLTLLATVSELRADLERTVSKIHSLEEQNRGLQESYQTVKDELVDTRKKFNEANQNYLTTVAEKLEAEKQSETFMDKIKQQLAEKTREFEQLRDKFVPQDIDYIRIKVQEELEVPHRLRIQALETDLEKTKESYYLIRRELERCKSEFESYSLNQKRIFSAKCEEYEAVVQSLGERLYEQKTKDYSSDKDDTIRTQRTRLNEVEQLYNMTKSQLQLCQRDRNEALHGLEQSRVRHEDVVNQLKLKASTCEAERSAYDQRSQLLLSEVDQLEAQLRALRKNNDDLSVTIRELRSELVEKSQSIALMKEEFEHKHAEIQSAQESSYRSTHDTIEGLNSRLRDREAQIRKLQRDLSEVQLSSERLNAEFRNNYSTQLIEYRQKLEKAEMLLSEARAGWKDVETRSALEQGNRQAELDFLTSELTTLKREKELLHSRIIILEQNSESQRKKTTLTIQDAKKNLQAVTTALATERTRAVKLEKECSISERRIIELEAEIKSLRSTEDVLRKQHELQWQELQAEVQQRYEDLGKAYREKLQRLRSRLKATVMKERQRGDLYRDKALEAHRRGRALSGAVAAAVGDYPTLLADLENVNIGGLASGPRFSNTISGSGGGGVEEQR